MATFQIYEDKENLQAIKNPKKDKTQLDYASTKETRQKLATLTNLASNKENAFEKQANKLLKNGSSKNLGASSKHIQQTDPVKGNLNAAVDESIEIVSVIENRAQDISFDVLEDTTKSFSIELDVTQKKDSTPMSVTDINTPMSVDKSMIDVEHNEIIIRHDRDRFFEVPKYQKDILSYLKDLEKQKKMRPRFDYMKKQPDINDSMRAILVDWLVEVCEEYRLQPETLCLAVSYTDRFLSYMSVVRGKLQLVGTAAMFIASKYEEIYPPEIGEFVYITDDTYTKQQVLRMEKLLLKVLSFDLCSPSTLSFINLFSSMMNIPDKVKFLAQYFCELSLLTAEPYLTYVPSQISAAALSLAFYNLGHTLWNRKMEKNFGYCIEDLKDIILNLSKTFHGAESLQQQAIQDKFKTSKYLEVSRITPKEITIEVLDEVIGNHNLLDNTAENLERLSQKTSSLLFN